MTVARWPWWKKVPRRRDRRRPGHRLALEWLENRILLSGTPLPFSAFDTAQAHGFLAAPHAFDLYRVRLGAGDRLGAAVSAEASGVGLASLLRLFDAAGHPLALDHQEGGDPRLTFQAATAGDYLVGVSSAPDDNYDPLVPGSGGAGATTGLYTLNLHLTPGQPAQADLAGSSFRLGTPTAAWGETVPVRFTVENRGAADAGPFAVQLLLSNDPAFGPASAVYQLPQTFAQPGLAAAGSFSPGAVTVTLPDAATAAAAGLPASGPVYLGLRIVPADPSGDAGAFDKSDVHRGVDWETLTVVSPAPPGVTNLSQADPALNTRADGSLAAGGTDAYTFTVSRVMGTGRLTATVLATPGGTLAARLTLSDAGGQVLLQSDGGRIDEHLQPGRYVLTVSARSGAGGYTLTTTFVQGNSPLGLADVGTKPHSVTVADVNGDGIPDLVVPNAGTPAQPGKTVSVLLGNGDGTFAPQRTFTVGTVPFAVSVADVNGDGRPDLIVVNYKGSSVSVLLGNGDGSFRPQQAFAAGPYPQAVVVADVTGDGIPDLVVADSGQVQSPGTPGHTVGVLRGNGDGTFQPEQTFATGVLPVSVAVADVTGDGIPDLVTANLQDGTVSVLLGDGHGGFGPQRTVDVGVYPEAVVVADLNGDGKPDLALTNSFPANTVTVLLGNGDGSFQAPHTFATGAVSFSVGVADVNGDGKPDLVTASVFDATVSVLLGKGDGTFAPQRTFATGFVPFAVAVADLNGDGKPDLVTADYNAHGVGVLAGNGDGSFQAQGFVGVGSGPAAAAVADLNGDHRPDVVTANALSHSVSVLLGNGDGSFQPERRIDLGSSFLPEALAVADVNGDGRPDLVVADYGGSTVAVLLGNGDGSFQPPLTFAVGDHPRALAVADVNGDNTFDIITANTGTPQHPGGTVSVLLGNGNGTFGPQRTFAVGTGPTSLAVADVNGDHVLDLVTANIQAGTVSVLPGNGDGTFGPQRTFTVGSLPTAVAVADVNGDGKPDLVVANYSGGTVSVLRGNGDGSFQGQRTFPAAPDLNAVAVTDVTGDGIPDLLLAGTGNPGVIMLPGNGDGSFRGPVTLGDFPSYAVVAADLNGDGRPDVIAADSFESKVRIFLGDGQGGLAPTTAANAVGLRNTPYLADLKGDGTADSVILDTAGHALFRAGLPGGDDQFAPPVSLNDKAHLGQDRPARDLTVLRTTTGPAVATADALPDPALSSPGNFAYTVSLYAVAADGSVQRTTAFATALLPTRIAAGDLTGNGLDDLVVADSLDNSVQVAFQQPNGTFSAPLTLSAGEAPSDIALTDVNGDGLPDIVVTNQASGDVTVFLNDPGHTFTTTERFRAGLVTSGLQTSASGPTVSSFGESVSLAAGDFTGTGRNDVVVVNRGAHSFSVLGNDGGGFADPQPTLTTSTGAGLTLNDHPGPVVAGDFNGDGKPDLAVLMEDRAEVWVYTGDGHGHFSHTFTIAAGTSPTGLSAVRDPRTGFLDLLVGDQLGDVLRLVGNSDGTFQPPPPLTGSRVSLAVQTVGNGQSDALVANQQTDRVTLQVPAAGGAQYVPVATLPGPLAPGAVRFARLEKDSPYLDAVVVGSGSNSILVYRGTGFDAAGRPTFAPPETYFVGTKPAGVTIADVNGDGVPDLLVPNQGSNDVSVLFGSRDAGGNWVATPGPRLKSGGVGPIAVDVVSDPASPGGADLVVTNGQSGNLAVLPGRGLGFFNDQDPRSLAIPGNPVITQPPVFIGPPGSGVVPTTGGLAGFNLGTFTAVPNVFPGAANVAAVQALANGNLIVALPGGAVEMLGLSPGSSLFAPLASFTPLTGVPSDPSALAVLENGEVLVTNQGEDQLFVYGLAAPAPAPFPVLPPVVPPAPTVPTSPVPEPSAPSEVPLALVVALVADVLPTGAAAPPEAGAGQPANPEANEANPAEVDPAGNEDEQDAGPQAAGPGNSDFDPEIGTILQEFDLYRKPDTGAWGGPITRRLLGGADDLAVDLWRAGALGLHQVEAYLASLAQRPPGEAGATDQADDPGAAPAVPGGAEQPAVSRAADAAPAEAPDRPAASDPPASPPRVPGPWWAWGRPALVTLAAGGLALWAERRARRGSAPSRPTPPPDPSEERDG
jgi:hypothetical protein